MRRYFVQWPNETVLCSLHAKACVCSAARTAAGYCPSSSPELARKAMNYMYCQKFYLLYFYTFAQSHENQGVKINKCVSWT